MRSAFGACAGKLIGIPVVGAPPDPDGHQRYVIEMDIAPHSSLCKDFVFKYYDAAGNAVSYVRDGSSNLKSTCEAFRQRKGTSFEAWVASRAEWRRQFDLLDKRNEVEARLREKEAELAGLEERKAEAVRKVEEDYVEELRSVLRRIDDEAKKKAGCTDTEQLAKLLKYDLNAAREALELGPRERSLVAAADVAQRVFPQARVATNGQDNDRFLTCVVEELVALSKYVIIFRTVQVYFVVLKILARSTTSSTRFPRPPSGSSETRSPTCSSSLSPKRNESFGTYSSSFLRRF